MKASQRDNECCIERWYYTKPDFVPDKDGNIVFLSKKSFGPLEVYQWGFDADNNAYECYQWLENDFYKYESYCRNIEKEELQKQIQSAMLLFRSNELTEWVDFYEKIIERLNSDGIPEFDKLIFAKLDNMEVKKTYNYYEQLILADLCQCAYCQNYIREIKSSYPLVTKYMQTIGIDIEKPFETMPLEPDIDGNIEYICAQYIVFGNRDGFEKTVITNVNIDIAESYPSTKIKDEHFVIEIYPIILKWVM